MADITGNTYSEIKQRLKVIFQRGKDVLDSELNEYQDIIRVMFRRFIQDLYGDGYISETEVYADADGATANTVFVRKGAGSTGRLYIGGMRAFISSDVTVSGSHYLAANPPSSNQTHYLYAKLTEAEIDAVADSSIVNSVLGSETTRRTSIKLEFFVDTSIPTNSSVDIHLGGALYMPIASIARTTSATITASQITDLRPPIYLDSNEYFLKPVPFPIANTRIKIFPSSLTLRDNVVASSQFANHILNFLGAQIDFQTGGVFAADGVTSLGVDFVPATIAANQYRWYSVTITPGALASDNTYSASVYVQAASSDGASATLAPKANYIDGYPIAQVVVHKKSDNSGIDSIVKSNIWQNIKSATTIPSTYNNNSGIAFYVSPTTITLTASSPRTIHVTLSGVSQTLTLPSATTLLAGQIYLIYASGAGTLVVKTNGGATLKTITQTSANAYQYFLQLKDNTTSVGVWTSSNTVPIAEGGTGSTTKQSAFDALSPNNTLGDVTYYSGTTNTILPANTTTTKQFFSSTGTGSAANIPVYSVLVASDIPNIDISKSNTGILPLAQGGTGNSTKVAAFNALSPSTTLGDINYNDGTNNVRLAGNTTSARKFLNQTGTGTTSNSPNWGVLVTSDMPAIYGKRFVSPSGYGTDTTFATAIAALSTGGKIIVLESITVTSAITFPANTVVEGSGPSTVITLGVGGAFTLSASCSLRDLNIYTAQTSLTMVSLTGGLGQIQNCVFDMPTTATGIGLSISSNNNYIGECLFKGVVSPSTGTGIYAASNTMDNYQLNNIFTV